jgi:choline kinase
MKAVILAAGRGSRMQSMAAENPKCLLRFRGKSLIEHSIEKLMNHFNPSDISIISGYKSESLSNLGIKQIFNSNWETTNIMGSLMVASEILQNNDSIIVYSDVFFEESAIQVALNSTYPSILSVASWPSVWGTRFDNPLDDLENFKTKNGLVTLIGGKARSLEDIDGQFAGIYTLTPSSWSVIHRIPNLQNLDSTTALNIAIEAGVNFSNISYKGFWAEFDSISDFLTQNSK